MNKQSMYCYPGTDVLVNKLGIQEQDTLTRYEHIVSTKALVELCFNPIKGNFDLKHLQDIHRYLFKDVYPFAGEIRKEDIAKGSFSFAKSIYIEESAKNLFQQLRNDQLLKGLTAKEFSVKAADLMAEINVLHPFREGNGRTQREFIRELAQEAGHTLSWSQVDSKELLQASIRSVANSSQLAQVIERCIVPNREMESRWIETDEQLKEVLKKGQGIPVGLSADDLQKDVARYSYENINGSEILSYQLKGDSQTRTLYMEKHPFLTKALKDALLDQATEKSLLPDRNMER